ncbi:flagellar hook-associated protein FlgK [Palleronia sp. KMU-117]|uniref:flagellar hook-associated protein FlgK n=1 Tax=Palleronia sp. KMU-117 TaxID=3434108 RepID=UPI003D70BB94
MSISGSLSNALSGLTASARATQLVSSNVANAMTEGYGRRELSLSARLTGGAGSGVSVDGVTRIIDETVLRDRRLADAGMASADTESAFFADLQALVGIPGDEGALSSRLAAFEAALIEASSRPDLQARLEAVARTAVDLASGLNGTSDGIQALRMDADAEIARTISDTNTTLARIAEVNALILRNGGAGRDVSSLLDQRQQLVDRLADVVPLRVLPRDNGTIAIYTQGGAALLDIRPAKLGFAPTATIVADMTQTSGALSGLTVNGQLIQTSGNFAPFAGGRLDALFRIRDDAAVTAQARVDAVARDLVERVTDPAVDATLAPGAAGLFTDAGAAFDPANEVGLAARLAVNAAVLPASGGALWRIRDGIAAAAPGEAGSNAVLSALSAALQADRTPSSGAFTVAARTASGLAGDLASLIGSDLRAADTTSAYRRAQLESLRLTELSGGVDTDQEMQKLLLIEQAYAANAQVIRTVDDLIQLLLGI